MAPSTARKPPESRPYVERGMVCVLTPPHDFAVIDSCGMVHTDVREAFLCKVREWGRATLRGSLVTMPGGVIHYPDGSRVTFYDREEGEVAKTNGDYADDCLRSVGLGALLDAINDTDLVATDAEITDLMRVVYRGAAANAIERDLKANPPSPPAREEWRVYPPLHVAASAGCFLVPMSLADADALRKGPPVIAPASAPKPPKRPARRSAKRDPDATAQSAA